MEGYSLWKRPQYVPVPLDDKRKDLNIPTVNHMETRIDLLHRENQVIYPNSQQCSYIGNEDTYLWNIYMTMTQNYLYWSYINDAILQMKQAYGENEDAKNLAMSDVQVEPLDLSIKVIRNDNDVFKAAENIQHEECERKENLLEDNNNDPQEPDCLKDLISRKIIEYRWDKKKKMQRKRFKMRRHLKRDRKQLLKSFKTGKCDVKHQTSKPIQGLDNKPDNFKTIVQYQGRKEAKPKTQHSQVKLTQNFAQKKCSLSEKDLVDGLKILFRQEGVFYPAKLSILIPGNVYSVLVDRQRGNKPHILSLEEVYNQTIIARTPTNVSELCIGTRVCAYWSSKMTCLHPGVVVGPDSSEDHVIVQHDDGDCRDININHVRYLPPNYPFYDPDVSLAAKYPSLSMMRIKQLSGIKTPLGLDTVKRKTKPKS